MSSTMICANAETAAVSSDHGREGTPDGRRASRARVGRAAARGPAPASSNASRLDRSKGRSCVPLRRLYLGPALSKRTMAICMEAVHERRLRRRDAPAPAGAHARRLSATSIVQVWRVGSVKHRERDEEWRARGRRLALGAAHDDGRRGRRPRAAPVGRVGARGGPHAAHAAHARKEKSSLLLRPSAWRARRVGSRRHPPAVG